MRVLAVGVVIVMGITVWGCSGSGYSSGTGGNPNTPTPIVDGIVTINVVAENGAQSFSPNPSSLPTGQMVVWHNVDRITHRVVLDDLSVDTGDLAPGASSRPLPLASGGGPYHCSIHPAMIGRINQNTSANDPALCGDPYCN